MFKLEIKIPIGILFSINCFIYYVNNKILILYNTQ